MSETLHPPVMPERSVPTHEELLHLGEACMAAAMRTDLAEVVAAHKQYAQNPNVFGEPGSGFLFGEGDVPTSSGSVYRQVGIEAVQDLADSGIVRNGATAQGEGHRRWGHNVFWNAGEDGKATITGGRAVLEAPADAGKAGWVTADKLPGIHVQMPDGQTKNILKP